MNERDLIRRLARYAPGIGDDCAVLRVPDGAELLVTTDQFIQDVHFRRGAAPPSALGARALARAVSDIASMGGDVLAYFVSVALPEWACGHWVNDFYRGMRELKFTLAGGDTTRAKTFYSDFTVLGTAPAGTVLRRDTAQAGDALYVSGELGVEAVHKRVRLEPRLKLGRYLRENAIATACMDISDGLALDASRLGERSGLAVELDHVPTAKGATEAQALSHGEDYELLFAVGDAQVPATFDGIPLTRVGTLRQGRPGALKLRGRAIKPQGWNPFKK